MRKSSYAGNGFFGYKSVVLFAAIIGLAGGLPLQADSVSRYRSRYNTPYMNAYARRGYVSPYPAYITPVPANPLGSTANSNRLPPVSGPVTPYSDVEYGKIVQMAVNAARQNSPFPVDVEHPTRLIDLATTKTATGQTMYAPVAMNVTQVLDRGIILLTTGEELRLRGVFMPSSTDTNDVRRLYAKEGVQVLSNITNGATIYVLLDDPVRDKSGHLLGTVLLQNGTELNSLILSRGYGSLTPEDFAPGVDFSDLKKAESAAKAAKLGIWSR